MHTSKFLAKVLGLYLVIVSVAMLVNVHQFINYVTTLINDKSAMLIAGFFTLILGLLMVVSHNIWQWNWRIIITIISWLALLKGISIIFYPQFMDETTQLFIHNMLVAYVAAGIDFVLGVILIYFGFIKN